jgi:hypothetical protein
LVVDFLNAPKPKEYKMIKYSKDEAAVMLLNSELESINTVNGALENFLLTIENVDVSNRAGTNSGNFLTQVITQAKSNITQFDYLLKDLTLRLEVQESIINPALVV